MKRLNPATGLPFKHGDLREDGFMFSHYRCTHIRKDGYFQEEWASPKAFKKVKASNKKTADNQMATKAGHISRCFASIKCRAAKSNTPFLLTLEHITNIAPDMCPVLGIPLGWAERNKTVQRHSPSLDKIIPELGYVDGNVQWLSQKANSMKQDATTKELVLFAQWVLAPTRLDV